MLCKFKKFSILHYLDELLSFGGVFTVCLQVGIPMFIWITETFIPVINLFCVFFWSCKYSFIALVLYPGTT